MKKIVLVMLLALTSSYVFADAYVSQNSVVDVKVDTRSSIILKDKSGNFYEIYHSPYSRHGVAEFSYYVRALGDEQATNLGGGLGDPVIGGCGRNFSQSHDKGVLETSLEIKKVNRDGWFDIVVEYIEEDCKTGDLTKTTNIFYATEHGFKQATER